MTACNCCKCLPDETAEGRHVPRVRLILLPNMRISKNMACQKKPTEPESKQGSSAKWALLETRRYFPINDTGVVSEARAAAAPQRWQPPQRSCPHQPPARHRRLLQLPRSPNTQHQLPLGNGYAAFYFDQQSTSSQHYWLCYAQFRAKRATGAAVSGQWPHAFRHTRLRARRALKPPHRPRCRPSLRRPAEPSGCRRGVSHLLVPPAEVAQQPPQELQQQQRHGGSAAPAPPEPKAAPPIGSPQCPRHSQWAAAAGPARGVSGGAVWTRVLPGPAPLLPGTHRGQLGDTADQGLNAQENRASAKAQHSTRPQKRGTRAGYLTELMARS